MFIEPYNNYYQNPMWRNVPIFPEAPMTPLPYPYNDDERNQKSMFQNPSANQQSNMVMQEPKKTMEEPKKSMQGSNKTMPQVHADFQNPEIPPTAPVIDNPLYNQGWLKTQIGKFISIDFLIGNMYIDRQGILQEVGISYVVIKESGTNDIVMCDIYSIKFVTVFGDQNKCRV